MSDDRPPALLRRIRRTARVRAAEEAAEVDELSPRRSWTIGADRAIEAIVLDYERRGRPMPGLRSHRWSIELTEEGDVVIVAEPPETGADGGDLGPTGDGS